MSNPVKTATDQVFDPASMRERREAYFSFVRRHASQLFQPDGSYQPTTETDGRIAYWILPAFLESGNQADREFGLRIYAAGAGWKAFDIFMTSCVAAHLARHGADLSPELRLRSEEHLSRFTVDGGGRLPSSGVYDYMFHGYNDNMPGMATRTLILAGDLLGRKDFMDQGLFNLEGLCAHFQRRGLASEHTSATYSPICLVSMLDIAECSATPAAREMAQACADRILVDLLGHWHWGTGSTGGTMSRAYTTDITETLSVLNAYMWYVSGHPLTLDPREALDDPAYDGPMHHGRNRAFNMAQFVEVMNAAHSGVRPGLLAFARQPRLYPYLMRATADWSDSGPHGGCRGIQTRSFQQPQWWLATSSTNNTGGMASQTLVLHGAFAVVPVPKSWRDRIAFWPRLVADSPDHGEPVRPDASPHAGALRGEKRDESVIFDPLAESDHVTDCGRYQTLQKAGSAMLLGGLSPDLDGREISRLAFAVYFASRGRQPDESYENDISLATWEGEAAPNAWQFLRFGEVYIGLRLSAGVHGTPCPVRRALRDRYLRLETALIEGAPRRIDRDLRGMSDIGLLIEMGSRAESGSFAEFRSTVLATAWEFHHNFYRCSRALLRSGELQIIDSPLGGTARFLAVDGEVESETRLEATGLDPVLAQLFPDGRRIRQRRTLYRPDCCVSPFYKRPSQVLVSDPMERP
jgi:hypothetical protein